MSDTPKYEPGNDCIWDHCSSIATCPCCSKDMEIEKLERELAEMKTRTEASEHNFWLLHDGLAEAQKEIKNLRFALGASVWMEDNSNE